MSTRHPTDYYATPIAVIEAVSAFLPEDLGRVLDPCAGDGRFGRVLHPRHRVLSWTNIDICPQWPVTNRYDFLTFRAQSSGPPIHTIVSNPPFSRVEEFIEESHAWEPDRIVFLARLALLEGQARYRRIWQRWPPALVAVLTKRPSFTANGQTDSAAYAWFGWGDLPVTGLRWVNWGQR